MVQLTGLSLPKLEFPDDLLELFNPASLTLSLDFLPDVADTSSSWFDVLQGTVGATEQHFRNFQETLPTSPDDLLEDLFNELKKLGLDSQSISELIKGVATPLARAHQVFGECSGLQALGTDVVPLLLNLSTQSVNVDTLAQILPITATTSLTTNLPTLLEPHLETLQQVQSQLDSLLQKPDAPISRPGSSRVAYSRSSAIYLLSDYDAMLQSVLQLPSDASSLIENPGRSHQVDAQIEFLEGNVKTAEASLKTVQTLLQGLADPLNNVLDQASSQLLPQELARQSNFLGGTLTQLSSLDNVDVSTAASKIKSVVQPLQALATNGVELMGRAKEMVQTLELGITAANQAVVKVSSLVTNVINQLADFIQQTNFATLAEQAKATFDSIISNLNQIFDQIGQVIEQIYTYARRIIAQVKDWGTRLPLMTDKFNQLLNQITDFLYAPQVDQAVQQVKQGISLVIEKLDNVSLKPIFDQVLTQVDSVKTSLRAVDLPRLNRVLKKALSEALGLVRNAIDPPIQIKNAVIGEYSNLISQPILNQVVYPVKQEFDSIVQLIEQLNPGVWVGETLMPPYQKALDAVNAFVTPEKIGELLRPLSDLQRDWLKKIEQTVNPTKLLQPLVKLYEQIVTFVRSLQPNVVQDRLNQLVAPALQSLDNLKIEDWINTLPASIEYVTAWINNIPVNPIHQPFWDQGIASIIATWTQKLKTLINQMTLPALQTLLQPLSTAMATLHDQTRLSGTGQLNFVVRVQQIVDTVEQYATQYEREITALTETWKQARQRLQEPRLLSRDLQSQYDDLREQLDSLNPIQRLAALTEAVDRLKKTAAVTLDTLTQIWQGLERRFYQNCQSVDRLLDPSGHGFKEYLGQTIDMLVDRSLQGVIRKVAALLVQLRGITESIQELQKSSQVFSEILLQIQRLVVPIQQVKQGILSFDFGTLLQPLQQVVSEEFVKPLQTLNPQPLLIIPLTQLYDRAMKMLEGLNPWSLFATPRGMVTIRFKATDQPTVPLSLPQGTKLIATRPEGDIWFETLQEKIIPIGDQTEIPVRAMVAERYSDLVTAEGVTWRVVQQEPAQPPTWPELQVELHQPILSLITLIREELLGLLQAINPMELIAEPLNNQYKKLVERFNELGIATLFDAFLQKLESLDQEIQVGLDQVITALSGLIVAMPL